MFSFKKKTIVISMVIAMVLILGSISPSKGFWSVDEPRYGGTLIISEDEGLETFNPNYKLNDYEPVYHIFSRLVQQAFITGEIIPDLAYDWEVSDDKLTWTFHLFDNVTWHDGAKFSSADVKWSFDSILEEQGAWSEQIGHIESIDAPDDNTVIFNLDSADAIFPFKMVALNAPAILPKHLYEGTDPYTNPVNEAPVGTGPFKWSPETTSTYTVMVRNENYFRGGEGGLPYLDKIIMRYIPERSTSLAAMEVNEIQASYTPMKPADAIRLMGNPNFKVYTPFLDSCHHIDFNVSAPPFDDIRVREAMAYAINKTDLSERLEMGMSLPLETAFFVIPPWVPSDDPDAQLPGYDPQKAEELLDAAGYPRGTDGIRFESDFWSWTIQDMQDQADILTFYWEQIGVRVTPTFLDSPTYHAKVIVNHDFTDMTISGGYTGWDPDGMKLFVGTGGPRNVMEYSNARVDELFQLGITSADPEIRKPYYDEIQLILREEMPRIPLQQRVRIFIQRTDYSGYYWEPEPGALMCNKQLQYCQWEGGVVPTPTPTPTPSPTPTPPGPGPLPIAELNAAIATLGTIASNLQSAIGELESEITNLNNQMGIATNIAYIAAAIAVISVIAAAIVVIKRK